MVQYILTLYSLYLYFNSLIRSLIVSIWFRSDGREFSARFSCSFSPRLSAAVKVAAFRFLRKTAKVTWTGREILWWRGGIGGGPALGTKLKCQCRVTSGAGVARQGCQSARGPSTECRVPGLHCHLSQIACYKFGANQLKHGTLCNACSCSCCCCSCCFFFFCY